ncbi:hypothetical protein PTTG_30554, partial [Puccinia triticina 1-1 BBBD Race 1]
MPPKSQAPQGTEDINAGGYATDQSQLRRSARASSAALETGMVATPSDSRVRLTKPGQAPAAASLESGSSKAPRAKPKKKRIIEQESLEPEATPAIVTNLDSEAYDFSQDTDKSIEIQPREAKKNKVEKQYDDLFEFFEEPFWKKGDKPNTQINYKCKWCGEIYRAHATSRGNLKVHRDGSTQSKKKSHGCVNREKAKKAGEKLPLSVAERNISQANGGGDPKQTVISGFLQPKTTFVNRVLNQLIMMWQIQQALPWSRIEDPSLHAAFQYSNPKAILY